MMKVLFGLAVVSMFIFGGQNDAQARRSSYHSSSHSSGHHGGFATCHCKRSSCFAKHPGGTYVHPFTHGRRH